MTAIRVQATFQGGSGLPEDRFVNTFHFADDELVDSYLTLADDVRGWVSNFYTASDGADALGLYLSPYVARAFTVTSYNLLVAAGERAPTSQAGTLANGGTEGLPEEVAICLTLRGAAPITPRRRGRIFIGPLQNQSTVLRAASISDCARPLMTGASNVADCILAHANALADTAAATLPWVIRSTTPTVNYVPIESGYVDDAFDTQRRRGPDPTTRSFFTTTHA